MAAIEHKPQSVWPVNGVPGGYAQDNRPESARVYPPGKEPASAANAGLAVNTDITR